MLITGFYGSTNDDGADHTLITRIILDNPSSLLTRSTQPYSSFLLSYPSGAHVLCAFFVTLFGVSIQKIVIMISVVLPCLIALAFYSTIKYLFENRLISLLGLIVAGFFTIGVSWAPVFWGGLPLLLSLYLTTSAVGLIYVFILKQKMTYMKGFFLGLILFVTSQTYPAALLIVFLWFLLLLGVKSQREIRNLQKGKIFSAILNKRNLITVIAFLLPIFMSFPYFFSVFKSNLINAQSTMLISNPNVSVEMVKGHISFNWLLDIPALSSFFSGFGKLLLLAPISIFLLAILLIPSISQRVNLMFPFKKFSNSLLLIYLFMLLIMSYLTLTLFVPINFLTASFNAERVLQHIFIPATIMTAFVIFSVIYFSYLALRSLIHRDRTSLTKLNKNRILACALLALVIFNIGILAVPVIAEQQGIYNGISLSFNSYQTLNHDDLSLMKWIQENVPAQSHILVSAGDSGQFVTSVTQRQTISMYSYLQNYSDLMAMLTSNSSDLRAVPIMMEFNVTYVYIGSTATTYALQNPDYRHFNVTQFQSTPYFTLTRQAGDAWLFKFNSSAALVAYNSAGPLPKFVDQWHPSSYINILDSAGGYTNPSAGIYYGSGRLAIYAFANQGYTLDHWMINGSYLSGPENPVNIDYWNWNVQPVFTKNT
jgi:hypothetical protein